MDKKMVQITDSEYVVVNMRIMTRMGDDVLKHINGEWVKCLHTLGAPFQEGDTVLAPERH